MEMLNITPNLLLNRLHDIGQSLSHTDSALALIGLGSVGTDLDRLDTYSDLDFFVIVQPGRKGEYIDDLSWLTSVAPVVYQFRNTPDGYKLMFDDGIFCEFAVFEELELAHIPFPEGRVVWKVAELPHEIASPHVALPAQTKNSTEFLVGEALTNLYVGLLRDRRGEKLSGMRFIQGYAVDRIIELCERLETAVSTVHPDPFGPERRFEQRYPSMAHILPTLLRGYEQNRVSALAALSFLDQYFELNTFMKNYIQSLCSDSD